METTEKIDQDLASLSSLQREKGMLSFLHTRKGRYGALAIILLACLFIFGFLARPAVPQVILEEAPAVLDAAAPRVVNPELSERVKNLHINGKQAGALLPVVPSEATMPRIVSWTPNAIGMPDAKGQVVPLSGTYEIPGGWYGAIRLLSDGKEIGSAFVDARTKTGGGKGSFILTPQREEGQHTVRLVFDAVSACRIACDPGDQLCIATNVNYCYARSDNQVFLSYAPVSREAMPPIGECTTKTFVAGPTHAPQREDEYPACDVVSITKDLAEWLSRISGNRGGIYPLQIQKVIDSVTKAFLSGERESVGSEGNIQ